MDALGTEIRMVSQKIKRNVPFRKVLLVVIAACLILTLVQSILQNALKIHSNPVILNTITTKPEVINKVYVDTHRCDSWFKETFEDNLKVISEYPRGQADKYMWRIRGNLTKPRTFTTFPVITTAANSEFYDVSKGLLRSIHDFLLPKYKSLKIIYYDMGLDENQIYELKKHCACEVRKFPFENFPVHVSLLKTYTWKPILVQTLLMEFGWVWWMDSSVRFKTNDLNKALQYSIDNSILFGTYDPVLSVSQHTDLQTMEYLHESPCKFRNFGEIEATFLLFHFDSVTNVLADAWTACALNKECMAPSGTEMKMTCTIGVKTDGKCHRFDQAVLSIILRRLYHKQNDYPLNVTLHLHEVLRGSKGSFYQDDTD